MVLAKERFPLTKRGTIHRRVMEIHPSSLSRGFIFSFSFCERRSFEKEEDLSLPVVYLLPVSASQALVLFPSWGKEKAKMDRDEVTKQQTKADREERKAKKKSQNRTVCTVQGNRELQPEVPDNSLSRCGELTAS
jgi:hypothetical protein